MRNHLLILIVYLTFLSPAKGQNYVADAGPDQYFREGIELMEKQKYSAARETFERYLSVADDNLKTIDAEYYIAFSALRLYNGDGEAMLEDFTQKYEYHPKSMLAFYELGNFFFRDQKYEKAIEYFEKVDTKNLSREQQNTLNFKLGYAYFSDQKFQEALPHFNRIKGGNNAYASAASYYAGYIAYRSQDYDEAITDLKNAEKDADYASIVPYMIANIYYEQKQYNELITYGENIRKSDARVKNEPDIMLLVGEAYYQRENYAQAAVYLEEYASNRIPDNGVWYRLAYAQYKSGAHDKAIENFKQIAAKPDTIGQFASYYLGVLYVEQENFPFAATALEKASKQDYDMVIKEQALFNLGKVHFEAGDHARAIEVLSRFSKTYPNSKFSEETHDLLSEAYLNTRNYDQALAFIENLPNKSEKVKRAYQKVTYYKGTEEFNNSRFFQSVQLFEKSLQYPYDKDLVVTANFWRGEAYSVGKKYEEAIEAYNGVFNNINERSAAQRYAEGKNATYALKAHYGIGYAYYNTKQYVPAQTHFKNYVDQLNDRKGQLYYEDALIRLADCYYVNKLYAQSISLYDQAIKENNPDKAYAYYQKGVVLGIQGNYAEGKASLDVVIDRYGESRYYDDAIFQKAQLDFEQGNYQAAIGGFSNLIEKNPESNLLPYALLRRALSNSNLNNYSQTVSDYQQILDEYITHEVANSALLGLQQVEAQPDVSSNSFSGYLARYKQAHPDDNNLAGIEFESAKNLYFSQKYDAAIVSLQSYVENYPESPTADEAKYYIAESFYRKEDWGQAKEYYEEIVEAGTSDRLSRATNRIAEIEFQLLNYRSAIDYYKKLEKIARNKREQYDAWAGQMEAYYELGKKQSSLLDSTEKYARLILDRGAVAANATNQAQLYLGKAAYQRGDNEQAIDNFLKTLNAAKDESGAEAQYLMAEIQYKKEQYKQSIETLYDLNKNFPIYEYWLGKSFLLIADNYIALEENFQAKATLNSLIENSPMKVIIDQARAKLAKLESEEQKQEEELRKEDSLKLEQENQIVPEEDGSLN